MIGRTRDTINPHKTMTIWLIHPTTGEIQSVPVDEYIKLPLSNPRMSWIAAKDEISAAVRAARLTPRN